MKLNNYRSVCHVASLGPPLSRSRDGARGHLHGDLSVHALLGRTSLKATNHLRAPGTQEEEEGHSPSVDSPGMTI